MKDSFDNKFDGQLTIEDILNEPERLFAVSNIFARARKEMSLNEQKTFVYALTEIKYREEMQSDYVRLDKKVLAAILNNHSDIDHLSRNLYDEIKEMPKHSYIEISSRDLDLYSSGFIITAVTRFKNIIRLRFNREYLPLFTNLSSEYITMWSGDIFQMTSKRSVQFYELLRQMSYDYYAVGTNMFAYGWGIKALKEMFNIPKDGKGSYMREKGGFDRFNFEKYVIQPLCEDLAKCKMIQLVVQQDGKMYEKVKRGNRVDGYRFYWMFSAYPRVATAQEVKEIQDRVDKNPEVLKLAKDILDGTPKPKKSKMPTGSFYHFEQRQYGSDLDDMLLEASMGRHEHNQKEDSDEGSDNS